MASLKGRRIGRYWLFDELASGGMATIHLGRAVGSGGFFRVVAIKRPHPQFSKNARFVAMFLDEGRLAGRIQHPNVVPVLDVVAESGEPLLVMDYVHGVPLSRLLDEGGGPVDPAIASAVMGQVLRGLEAAHSLAGPDGMPLGIVHRDVSPQNVLVGVDGVARVTDFGIAKAIGQADVTREGHVKGKIGYMAPEQLKGESDRRSDVFTAAIVLWECLAGERLFGSQSDAEAMYALVHKEIAAPKTKSDRITSELNEVVMRGLARDPEQRYRSAGEMAEALERAARPASSSEVAAWVSSTCGSELAARAAQIALVERGDTVSDGGVTLSGETPSPSVAPGSRMRMALAWFGAGLLIGGALVFARRWASAPPAVPSAASTAAPIAAVVPAVRPGTITQVRVVRSGPIDAVTSPLYVGALAGGNLAVATTLVGPSDLGAGTIDVRNATWALGWYGPDAEVVGVQSGAGSGAVRVKGMATGPEELAVTGTFTGTEGRRADLACERDVVGVGDLFLDVLKRDRTCAWWLRATGEGAQEGQAVAIDRDSGAVALAGHTSQSFALTFGTKDARTREPHEVSSSEDAAFVAMFDRDGKELFFHLFEQPGVFFRPTAVATTGKDGLVVALTTSELRGDSNGMSFVRVGVTGLADGRTIRSPHKKAWNSVDAFANRIALGGDFAGSLPLEEGVTLSSNVGQSGLVAVYDGDTKLVASRTLSGTRAGEVKAVRWAPSGDLYVAGWTDGPIDLGDGKPLEGGTSQDVFVARFNAKLDLLWGATFPADNQQIPVSLDVSEDRVLLSVYVKGDVELGGHSIAGGTGQYAVLSLSP